MIGRHAKTGFAAGAILGGAIALAALLVPDSAMHRAQPAGTVSVNGQPITLDDVDLALDAIDTDSRNPRQPDAAAFVLERLIDEELLFQRAIEIDLPRNDSTIRRSIVLAMIDAVIAQAPAEPDESELRALFEAETSLFAGEPELHIRWEVAADANAPRTRPAAHPADRPMTLTELRRAIGPTLTAQALELEPGDVSQPIEISDQLHWVTLIDRRRPASPVFEDHRDAVEALWRDRTHGETLNRYLARLRDEADIRHRDEDEP